VHQVGYLKRNLAALSTWHLGLVHRSTTMTIILGDKNGDKLDHDSFGYVLDNDNRYVALHT